MGVQPSGPCTDNNAFPRRRRRIRSTDLQSPRRQARKKVDPWDCFSTPMACMIALNSQKKKKSNQIQDAEL
eukprot:m.8402 g.8402  ORF g.8402 m.8402 type:complete len:71 (+) comp3883_c0_seq1:2161-2373(+)